ncbi:MAG: amino acid permease, partial [Alphaproteobacteria bacterium]|nr:amino acid permease [Alphaproteobacteria bacterium]
QLKRALNLPLLTLYGLGTTIGAGIYVLIGAVAGSAGGSMWISFLLASLLAGLTALSFAEMASRYPSSAGEAVYTYEGLGSRKFATLVGLSVALTGIISSAAIARGFIGYLSTLIEAPDWLILIVLIATLGGLAAWGIAQSVLAAAALSPRPMDEEGEIRLAGDGKISYRLLVIPIPFENDITSWVGIGDWTETPQAAEAA